MIDIKVTYAGKNYESISDPMKKAAVDGIKDKIAATLAPFEQEIRRNGGNIIVNIPEDMQNMKVQVTHLPDDVKGRIMRALMQ